MRIVSEDEAKKLWCPFLPARPIWTGGNAPSDECPRQCLASACMMWQEARLPGKGYFVTKDDDEGKPVPPAQEPLGRWEFQPDPYAGAGRSGWRDINTPMGGFCGLVGNHR